jgi:hemerythrin superfamily protein
MDALTLLKSDHRAVEGLFKQVEEQSDTAHATRRKLFTQIKDALTEHARIEETVFYPAFKARTKRNTEESDEVLEAYEEHGNVKAMLEKLSALEPDDETYNAKLQVLSELVKHHVKEEETMLFKQAKQLFDGAELEELGEELEAAKEAAAASA